MNDDGITTALITEILGYVKLQLNITNTEKDNLLSYYITALCNNILIKTNRRVFPEQLKYVVVDSTVNKFNDNKSNEDLKTIASMSEYDRSVSFGVSDADKIKLELIARKQIEDNEILISKLKLLYKT